jgi:tetratricopeptide (TPR) repeat protein
MCVEHWLLGDHDAAMTHLDEARRLVEPLPPSRSKALVIATASRLLMLASKESEAIAVGEQGLTMAEALGLDEIRAASLVNIGSARAALDDDRGFVELSDGIELSRETGAAFDMCRGMGNLAARRWARGELGEAIRLWREAEREAQLFGQMGFARWFRAVLAGPEYELADWDSAHARAQEFLAEVEAGSPHYLASPCYLIRGLIRHARDDRDGSIADIEVALGLARRAKDPQSLYPAYAVTAHVLMELGERERALPAAEEFLAGIAGGPEIGFADTYLHILSWTLTEAGRGEECAAALEPYSRIPWARIGIAFGLGDPAQAAELAAEIGAFASEAYCRLSAVREGDLGQLERALAFYRSVGATRYVREGESLLAASA